MLQLYIANKNYSSWSLRPWLLMKQLGIAFEARQVRFGENFHAFSPSGRVPCLIDDKLTIWDSLAITEYLAETYPSVWPADKQARAWARCACAEMHSGFHQIRGICAMNCGIRVRLHTYTPALLAEWSRIDQLWNEGLTRFGGPFLAGNEFTAADAFYAPIAFRVQTYSPTLSVAANAYAQRLLALPAMREWYSAGIAETWRDDAHEVEVRTVGVWLQDLRAAPRG